MVASVVVVVAAVVVVVVSAAAAAVVVVSEEAAMGFWRILALTFEFCAAIILELLRGPVETFIPPPLLEPLLAAVAVDPPFPGAEIVMFKNGLRKLQKIASVSFGCKKNV